MVKDIDSINTASKTFCIMPWTHQNLSLPGVYKPCCNTHVGYNITTKETSLKGAFFSDEAKKLRQQLNAGERPEICNACWIKEDAGIESYRESFNELFEPLLSKDPALKFIDVEFDNVCNLQCRMCSPHNSDQIWKTVDLLKEKKLNVPSWVGNHERHQQYDQSKKKQDIKDVLETIKIFKVTGGEPFLSKDFLEIVDFAIKKDFAENINLKITTNGTKFSKTILDKLKFFKWVDMNISIDGFGNVYDYIRYPFSWAQLEKRMNELKSYDFNIEFSCVVLAYNWLNLDQLVLNCRRHSDNDINFNFALYPFTSELSSKFLPDHILDLGLERFKATEHYQVKDFENYVAYHKANRLSPNQLERKNDELYETTTNFDIVRNQSYKTLDPVLVKWLDSLKI